VSTGQQPRGARQDRYDEGGAHARVPVLRTRAGHHCQVVAEAQGPGVCGVRQREVGARGGGGNERVRAVRQGAEGVAREDAQRRDGQAKGGGDVRGAQEEAPDAEGCVCSPALGRNGVAHYTAIANGVPDFKRAEEDAKAAAQPPTTEAQKPRPAKSGAAVVPDEYVRPNKTLFLQNIPRDVDEEALSDMFERFEGFKEVRLVSVRAVAFAEFENEQFAITAKEATSGTPVGKDGVPMKVTYQRQ
jgi:hypothetical protein